MAHPASSSPLSIVVLNQWFTAIGHGDVAEITRLLAEWQFPIDTLHPLHQHSGLMEAIRIYASAANIHSGDIHPVILWLLQQGASPTLCCGLKPTTALHMAIRRQHWRLVIALATHTTHCDTRDAQQQSPLHLLASQQPHVNALPASLRAAELLIAKTSDINARDADDATALHLATIGDWPEMVHLMLLRGADANATIASSGVTPLMIAALESREECARILMHYGASLDMPMASGLTPRMVRPAFSALAPAHGQAEILALPASLSTPDDALKSNESY
jgi:hypothetical protein